MRKFDSEAGLCHLVFANEDTYYTKSLFKLNLRQYLYYELRGKEYDAVYFISGDESGYDLVAADDNSLEIYEKYEKQSILDFFKGKGASRFRAGQKIEVEAYDQLLLKMIQMMKKEKEAKLAFVFTIEAFSDIARFPDIVSAVCRLSEKNYSRGHLILIQAPVVANGSLNYLADEEGVFRSELFPEIQRIFESHKNIKVYECLKEELGQRVSFLNALEREQIHNMVSRFLMEQSPGRREAFAKACDYGDFIWGWYHSSGFREKAGALLPENGKRLMSRIRSSLTDKSILGKLDVQIERIRQGMGKQISLDRWIAKNYSLDSWLRLIYEDNMLLSRLEQLSLTKVLEKAESFSADMMKEKLKRIREDLQKPGLFFMDSQAEEYTKRCMDAMRRACLREDVVTMEKAVSALEYGVCPSIAEGQESEEQGDTRRQLYQEAIWAAETLYDMTQAYEQDCKRIREYGSRMKGCMQELRDFEERNPQVVWEEKHFNGQDGGSPGLQTVAAKKSEIIALKNDIRNLKYLRASKQTMMSRCRENIQKLEMAISSMAVGNVSHLKETMDYTSSLIRSASQENQQLMAELSETSQESQIQLENAGMKEWMSAEGWAELEREFEALQKEQGTYQGEIGEEELLANG